jgi:uncharacterized protein
MDRTVRWRQIDGRGMEHLRVRHVGERIVADGTVVGERAGNRYGLTYRVIAGRDWRILHADFMHADRSVHTVLHAEGNDHWSTGSDHSPEPQLNGCTDLDFAATPFTNTLAIHRLNLAAGQSADIRTAYVTLPYLSPEPVDQRYTCLEPGRRYHYLGLFSNLDVELDVDEDGLVKDYPGLFERVR